MKTLESARLILRPVQTTDIPALSEILGDPEIMKYLFGGKPLPRKEAGEFIRKHFSFDEDDSVGMGTLLEKTKQQIIGFAGLISCPYLDEEDLELGFAISKSAQGDKYGKEIGKRQLEFGFSELNSRRLLGLVHPMNEVSRHILEENLGMKMIREIETDERGTRQVFCAERFAY
jgi:[ribosomal protein S5]-alanine N-acetyltransferase